MFHFNAKKTPVPSRELEAGTIRRHLVFHGRVQGVGFRYRAVDAARKIGITGWVKNEYDGTVVMEAQGTPEKINVLIKALRYMRYIQIDWVDGYDIPVEPKERSFRETY